MRIVGHGRARRTAALSLLIVALPALLVFMVWRYWQQEEEVRVVTRNVSDVVLDWECDNGHTFKARGQAAPRVCPTCRKPAYPVGTYSCPEHGPFNVSIRYSQDASGAVHPAEYRIAGRPWVSAKSGADCPKCKKPLRRKPADPFSQTNRSRQREVR